MESERHPIPRWVVVGAGTGGTSATIGRYIRYQRFATQVCVPDPTGSVFGAYYRSADASLTGVGSRIEGIGRPRVEVPNVESIAAMRALSALLGRKVGPSTGTNFIGMLTLAQEMRDAGEAGSILSLLCDAGERYLPSYHSAEWVSGHLGDCTPAEQWVQRAIGEESVA